MIISVSLCLIFFFEQLTGTNALKCMHKSDDDDGDKFQDIQFQQCTTGNCYSYWRYDPSDLFNASRFQLISSGCSDGNNLNIVDCDHVPQCISSFNSLDFSNNTSYCCCSGDMCNIEFSIGLINELLDDSTHDVLREDYSYTIFLVFVFCLLFLTFSIISAKLFKSIITDKMLTNHKTPDSLCLLESQQPTGLIVSADAKNCSDPEVECKDDLIFIEQIGHGKYGPIWKGKLNDATVAIKVCRDSKKHLWKNESIIYSLPLMANFHGSIDRSSGNGNMEHYLVIEYGHHGSLKCFLNEHTFDWSRMCTLFKSLVQGLSYLHTEIRIEDKIKPSIAHCDLCSSNIIVKADGTCMICDFQHAVDLTNNPSSFNTTERSNNVRYLAPEILDGTVNVFHAESILKQADVYSLGLVLWEIATRCADLYQGVDVPGFALPFEQEVGKHPSLDQMKLLVNRHKARPLFPDIWKNSNPAIRLLKETINECWDHEPEARLTALCIQERISELPSLWKRHKMETFSSCHVLAFWQQQEHSRKQSIIGGLDKSATESLENDKENMNMLDKTNHVYSNVCYINKFENSLHCKYNDHQHLLHPPQHKHYFHHQLQPLNNTNNSNQAKRQHLNVEKNFHMNSNNKSTNIDNHHQQQQQQQPPKLTLPLQPYHARNPCMERNLMIDDDLDERDEILEQGLKFKNPNCLENNSAEPSSSSSAATDPIDPNDTHNAQVNYSENRSLLLQTPIPIPFVRNYVHNIDNGDHDASSSSSSSIKIKDVNVYRNTTGVQCRRNFLVNFLKRKFMLDFFRSNSNDDPSSYLDCCDENIGRDIHIQTKRDHRLSPFFNDTKLTGSDSNPSSKMISTNDNYQFSTYGNLHNRPDSIVDAKTNNNKLNNSVGLALLKQDNIAATMLNNNKEQDYVIIGNNESGQPRMQLVD